MVGDSTQPLWHSLLLPCREPRPTQPPAISETTPSAFRVKGFGSLVEGLGFGVYGLLLIVSGSGFRVWL